MVKNNMVKNNMVKKYDEMVTSSPGARRALRSEMLRWHPDKFEARLGRFVRAADRERVNARVNVVAQLVAELFKQTAA